MIRGISHACYRVSDLDAAIGFYVDALGCRHAFDFTRDDGTRFGAYVYIGSRTFIELFQRDLSQPAPTGASPYQHLCLEVDDFLEEIPKIVSLSFDARGGREIDLRNLCWGVQKGLFGIVRGIVVTVDNHGILIRKILDQPFIGHFSRKFDGISLIV